MTTEKVMKLDEFEDSIWYRASCNCGNPKCDATIELEIDKEVQMIYMNLYKDLYWSSFWRSDSFFHNIWERIKCALRVLFNGHIEVEEAFLFQGDEQIDAFLNAIKEGREYLKEK